MSSVRKPSPNIIDADRFRLLVENINDYAVYMLTLDGIVASWNAGAERFKGYRASEIIGKSFAAFYSAEDQAAGLPARSLYIARAEGRFETEGWRIRKDGTRFWASVVIDPIKDDHGVLIGFAKITRDMSERRAAELALRRSEERFRLLVKGVTDYAIYMLSPEGLVTNWNAGAQRIKGYLDHEVIGSHFSRFYTPEDRDIFLPERALRTAAESGSFENEGWRVRKDGSRFWAHVVIDRLLDDAGVLVGFAKITRDITERRRAEQAVAASQAALVQSQKTEAIGRLTGGIAHDFNNLLGAIIGNLDLLRLRRATGQDGDVDQLIEAATAAAKRSAALTHRLLAYARQQTLMPSTVDVNQLIRSLLDLLQRSVGPAIEIRTELDAALSLTRCDRNQLESALLNLTINARDAMPMGGHVMIRTRNVTSAEIPAELSRTNPTTSYILVSVTDTGMGMSPEVAEHAFEPFFTTKPLGEGTGLGLSMVQGFIHQSQGHAVIKSSTGEGTAISLFLPALQHDGTGAGASAEDSHAASRREPPTTTAKPLSILLVDDEEAVRKPISEMLHHLGCTVREAGDAAAAIEVAKSPAPIDMLITDIGLPGGMNGRQLAGVVRNMRPDMKILFITGYAEQAIFGKEPLDKGMRLLAKPFGLEEFLETVTELGEL
ncbi:MAG: PAS domain S-box protein [Betaproteobacteria bacterium]